MVLMKNLATSFLSLLAILLMLSACQGSKEIKVEPAKLVPLQASITVDKLWSTSLGKGSEDLLLGLAPVSNGVRVFAASTDGNVYAFDALTGATKWRTNVGKKRQLSAGPGIGGDLVVVGTSDGELIALSIDNGDVRWSASVSSSVLATPAVSSNAVAVRTADGQLVALDSTSGTQMWNVDRRVQGLTLRGNSSPVFSSNAVLTGFDNGKIAAVETDTGKILWERSVAERRGRNELERLADVDGSIAINGEDAFVVGFQGRALLLSLLTGQPIWAQELSSHQSMAIDWDQVYVATADDSVVALDRRSGVAKWKQEALARREISAPVLVANSVVVGDFEGYLHWLSSIDGSFQARTRAGSGAVRAAPFAMGDIVYVQNEKGNLFAFRKRLVTPAP